ncbi:SCO1664 family protein [Pseudonocardia xishanensis]|uniref:SCO1664 family protein n=1 Tax=Pseudonocardia xishanensis TaxID=630995 RepID=A0ABP8RRJ7_9PSEU
MAGPDLRDPAVLDVLRRGRIEVTGRMVAASNATLVGTVSAAGCTFECVYKPVRGERPLWDFPDGTLAGREVASYLVSEAGGFGVVPPTVLRDGPFGPGMVQAWVDTETTDDLVDVCAPKEVKRGWKRVLRARDDDGAPAVLVHSDDQRLRAMAVFDVVANNADRKGGHVLAGDDGRVYGVDHGLTMHTEDKLRTVLWGWVGEELTEVEIERLSVLRAQLEGPLAEELGPHITLSEIRALTERVDLMLAVPLFPEPSGYGPAIPWPAF